MSPHEQRLLWQRAIRLIVRQAKTAPIKYEEQRKLEVSE